MLQAVVRLGRHRRIGTWTPDKNFGGDGIGIVRAMDLRYPPACGEVLHFRDCRVVRVSVSSLGYYSAAMTCETLWPDIPDRQLPETPCPFHDTPRKSRPG
jgi:hypothetical protein